MKKMEIYLTVIMLAAPIVCRAQSYQKAACKAMLDAGEVEAIE
jgi:hypothetical protein